LLPGNFIPKEDEARVAEAALHQNGADCGANEIGERPRPRRSLARFPHFSSALPSAEFSG
jgi:hypothetical protein